MRTRQGTAKNNQESQIKNLHIIEKQVQSRMHNPQQISSCKCNICIVNRNHKQQNKEIMKQTSSTMKLKSSKLQQFFRMALAYNTKAFLKLDIPEICFFSKGQPKIYYKSNNQGIQKVEITLNNKKNLFYMFMETHQINQSLNKKHAANSSQKFGLGLQDSHIKNFQTVIPRYKCGDQKTLKPQNFIFHNNPNYQDDPTENAASAEEVCLVKYKDKGFQLLNQKTLKQLLKSLLSLQNVEYIQSYIKPHETYNQFYEAHYDRIAGVQNQVMFSRSLTQVKMDINLINKLSKDYIAPEYLENYQLLLKEVPIEYCTYETYKIVHYIEIIRDVVVDKLSSVWVQNSNQQLCFIGLTEFEWSEKLAINVDVGEIQELKQLIGSQLTDFEQELMNAWESMKLRKQKPEKKQQLDIQKQRQIEKIKMQSSQRSNKRAHKGSIASDNSFMRTSVKN